MERKPKLKKCRHCPKEFQQFLSTQIVCSVECGLKEAKIQTQKKKKTEDKEERKRIKEKKEKLKTRTQWLKEAQTEFNKFIRLRDEKDPCISCGRHHKGQYQAGHYRTVGGNPELRFEELNVHKQCSACNNHLSGNIVEYRINLLKKIGQECLDFLEGPHQPLKLTIDQIKEIRQKYKGKCKEIEAMK